MIKVHAVNAFNDNYIWLISLGARQVAIVDPGDGIAITKALSRLDLIPSAILITHGCNDHVAGIEWLLQTNKNIPIYGPAHEPIPHLSHPLGEGKQINLGHFTFQVLDIPGHTPGHIAYYGHNILFVGDTLFTGGCGRLHNNPAHTMYESLEKIKRLPDSTQIYCGHEYTVSNLRFALAVEPNNLDIQHRMATSQKLRQQQLPTVPAPLAMERRTNPFLRCDTLQVKQAAEKHAGCRLSDGMAVFKTLRAWKDIFS